MNETFCGYCNRVFTDGRSRCDCGRETAPMTDAHRAPNVVLLSGTGAAKIWDREPVAAGKNPVAEALKRYGRLQGED